MMSVPIFRLNSQNTDKVCCQIVICLLFFSTMVYTTEERIEIVMIYGSENSSARRTAAVFNNRHPNKHVSHKYVIELTSKFRQTGSVVNKKRDNIVKVLDDAAQTEVLALITLDPKQSIRKLSGATGLSRSSVHTVLKKHNFHPYKEQLHQQLFHHDYNSRIEFCEHMTEFIRNNETLVKNICFTDECTFILTHPGNRHNSRHWSDENPYIIRESHTQFPQKLNVWAGLLGNRIVGPLFLEENLTGPYYLHLLETIIDPLITEILENDIDENGALNLDEELLTFQQDGAPAHSVAAVTQFLDNSFPNRWIGLRGPIVWPARSPDLTPLDFFLWGYLKSKVYATPPQSLQELRNRIIQVCRDIPVEIIQNAQ